MRTLHMTLDTKVLAGLRADARALRCKVDSLNSKLSPAERGVASRLNVGVPLLAIASAMRQAH